MKFSQLRNLTQEPDDAGNVRGGKTESRGAKVGPLPEDATLLSGIVKVHADGYRPSQLRVRAEMGKRMFTAEFLASDLKAIEADPKVEAVSIAKAVPLQKLPDQA